MKGVFKINNENNIQNALNELLILSYKELTDIQEELLQKNKELIELQNLHIKQLKATIKRQNQTIEELQSFQFIIETR